MKFSALALDYDGTIARPDGIDPDVRGAIAELRAENIVVMLATGRILDNLRAVAGDLDFVDAVVAENGAVIEFPGSGYCTTTGRPPPPELLQALKDDGIRFETGRVIVEADATDGERILAIVRRLELPFALLFNRDRVMLLPQGISKATGVRQALSILRLSPHNTVAIGDAENDHELLHACEVGVAVNWGSEALKTRADYVLPGDGPSAVASYIRTLASRGRVPAPVKTRRHLLLGHTDDEPISLAISDRNVLVAGDAKSGKSWVSSLLCEQLILSGYCLCILDPGGDHTSLESLPGVVVLGGAEPLPRPRELLRALRHPDVSVVIDLSHASRDDMRDYLRTVLPLLAMLRRYTGLPHRIVVDEADDVLGDPDVLTLLDLELNGYTLVTRRASQLHPDIVANSEAILVTPQSDPHEIRSLMALCRSCKGCRPDEWNRRSGNLVVGEAMLLSMTEEAEGEARRIRLAPRLTRHVRQLAKYLDNPAPHRRELVFGPDGRLSVQRVRTLREFVDVVERASAEAVDRYLRGGDFSRWVADVFGDYLLAHDLQSIEQEYRRGTLIDVAPSLSQAVRSRYRFFDPVLRGDD